LRYLEVEMPLDRSTRTLIAALLWVAAGFMIVNNIVTGADLDDWLLPLLFIVAGAVLYFLAERIFAPSPARVDEEPAPSRSNVITLPIPAEAHVATPTLPGVAAPVAADIESVDTQERSDVIAAVSSPEPEFRELQDPVENMLTSPTVSLEETEEVASAPTAFTAPSAPEINLPVGDMVTADAVVTHVPIPDRVTTIDTSVVESVTTPVQADTESVDTQERSDAIAAVSSPEPEFRELQDPVENMLTTPIASLEETDEVASAPTAFTAPPAPEINLPAEETVTADAVVVPSEAVSAVDAPAAEPVTTPIQADTESVDTQERSDALAAVGSPEEAFSELQDPVENMLTSPIASLEETDEVSGPPGRSISHGEAVSDDLTLIEGIGPKMSAALISANISTFAKLAEATEEQLRSAISAAGMRFSPSLPTWSQQATYAARGDFDGLRAYQQTLTAGRKSGGE
jgi:predicted flap endonuclease-1-like 5' DNA nuclease